MKWSCGGGGNLEKRENKNKQGVLVKTSHPGLVLIFCYCVSWLILGCVYIVYSCLVNVCLSNDESGLKYYFFFTLNLNNFFLYYISNCHVLPNFESSLAW